MSESIINLIGLSSGKDSTALWAWAFNESGYAPETIFGTFADTQNEYDEVYEQIALLDAYGQIRGASPVIVLTSEGFLNLAIRKKRFPSAKARFCTEELKIKPLQRLVAKLQEQGAQVVSHSGVRRSESYERRLLEEWGTSGMLKCKERRPLLDWTIEQVWRAHTKYGLPINPLYFTGRRRVGCRLCCMSNKQDVRITVKTKPWVIDMCRQWEAEVHSSFFHGDTIPIVQRSEAYTRRKDGKRFKVGTIDDVARWAFTLRGGTQAGFDFIV